MIAADVVARARSAVGRGCAYALDCGPWHPTDLAPWLAEPRCSCSTFVAWCLGVPRRVDLPYYREQNGGWFETSALARDAVSPFGFVERVRWSEARPGMLLLYGDYVADGKHHEGHVGLVATVGGCGPLTVVHCSSGNYRRGGDAIQETDVVPFVGRGIVARVAWLEGT